MPCRDYYDDHPEAFYGEQLADKEAEIERLKERISFAESALCGVLRTFEDNAMPYPDYLWTVIDYKGAGISRKELEKWFAKHKALDEKIKKQEIERIIREREQAERQKQITKKRDAALAKLTPEERKLLGIKS